MPVTENKIRKELRTMKKMIVAALSLALLISALALCACGKTPVEAGREKLISAANKIANNPNVPKRDAGTYEEKLGKYSVSSVFGADGRLTDQTYTTLSSENTINCKYAYEGGRVSQVTCSKGADGDIETIYFSYDKSGKMTGRKTVPAGGQPLCEKYEYDAEGKVSRISYAYGESAGTLYYGEVAYDESAGKITVTEKYSSGEPKSITERYYDADWDITKEEKTSESAGTEYITEYEKDGGQKRAWRYFRTAGGRICTEYDSRGLSTKETHYDESGAETGYTVIERGENGHRTGEKQYTPNGIICHEYEFPGVSMEGIQTETKELFYDENGKLTFYSFFDYNERLFPVFKETHSADGTLVSECEYTGNADRNIIKETRYGYGGAIESVTVYGYNERGKKISEKMFGGNGVIRYALEFNGTGREDINSVTREEIYGLDGELESCFVYEYNDAGFRTADIEYSPSGIIRTRKEYSGDSTDYWSHLERCIIYDAEGEKEVTYAYEYSEKGFRKIERVYDKADVLRMVIEYTGETDSYWNSKTREEFYDESGAFDGYIAYEHTEDGKDVSKEYDKNNVLCVMYEYINGSLYRMTVYNPDGTVKSVETFE